MKKLLSGFLLVLFSVSVNAGDVLFVEPLGQDGAMVKVDVFKAFAFFKKASIQTKEVYVERLNRPRAGQLYADATEGVADAPGVTKATMEVPVGIGTTIGKSITENPWTWGLSTLGVIAAGAIAADQTGLFRSGSSDDSTPPEPAKPTQQGEGTQSPNINNTGDGNTYNFYFTPAVVRK